MARHRNVRTMNYEDEYDGYDDVYGHSVEDDYCVSPSTAAQFSYDRNKPQELASFFIGDDIPEEDEEGLRRADSEGSTSTGDPQAGGRAHHDSGGSFSRQSSGSTGSFSRQDSAGSFTRPTLSDVDEAKLNSCLEEMRNILGDAASEQVLVTAVMTAKFDCEKAINAVLNQQGSDAPKPQRQPRQKRTRGVKPSDVKPEVQMEPPTPPAPVATAAPVQAPVASTVTAPSPSAATDKPQPVGARLTFTSGKQTQSGFTPEKQDDGRTEPDRILVDSIRRDLLLTTSDCESRSNRSSPGLSPDISPSESRAGGLGVEGKACSSGLSTPKKEGSDNTPISTPIHRSASKVKLERIDLKKAYERRKTEQGKDCINMVVIGHVDAGKSTLMGHALFQLGFVNKRTMHKYEQESKKLGKASFAYAWVLDETEEERSRGVTMDVAQTRFETTHKVVTLLDAPGHKDFIPNMITGAAQADVAILVVNSTRGEFETGFEAGGQTREHAMLVRSLGVHQLLVAVNKMDTVEWSQARYEDITTKLGAFLKQAGFKEADIAYIPCSGLSGENLVKPPEEPQLSAWYTGSTVAQHIDLFKPPERPIDKPLRMCIGDVFKGMGSGISASGTIQAGSVQVGERVPIMPQGEVAQIKGISIDDTPVQYAFAGDNVVMVLTGIDQTNIGIGSVLCDAVSPIRATTRFKARVVTFDLKVPITSGFQVILHYQSLTETAIIRRLLTQLHKNTGEVVKKKPRCLPKNTNAIVEIELSRPICLELYKDFRDLGRFMLRSGGSTIAAGLVTEIIDSKAAKAE